MAKDPAFLFYSSDFLSGISDLTMEERGQYITLLCLQHQKGELSEKSICLSVGLVSVDVMKKFSKNDEGLFFNKRLLEETEKRNKYTESRRNNGLLGGRGNKKEKPNCKAKKKHMDNHMEDVNENINEVIITDKKLKPEKFEIISKVFLSEIEKEKVLKEFGEFTDDALRCLSNYKNASGKNYKSDYHALIGWVKDKLKKESNGTKKSNIGVRAGQEHPLQHLHDLSIAVLEGIGRKNSEGGNV